MRSIRSALALSGAVLALTACDREEATVRPPDHVAEASRPAPVATGTVLTLAQRDPDFTTLVSALQTAGMEDMLNGAGPFTIFAPTNAAFEKIPAERRDALTTPEGRTDLRRLLTYHVVPGRLDAAALVQRIEAAGGSLTLPTMQGGVLTLRANPDGSLGLTDAAGSDARVVEPEMKATNGVIHAIDTVAAPG